MSRLNPITLLQELRRRRVFRVAALYGVGAWGVIAACDVIFPQLVGWVADPDRAMRSVFIAAIALFPVMLVFGWLYDVTAEGIQRTADFSETAHDPDTSLHPVDRGIIGTLSALVLGVLAAATVHIVRMEAPVSLAGSPAAPAIPENSIAVLPFEICEGPGVDPLLAASIASEVPRHLAEIPNLKGTAKSLIVISRTSVSALAGTRMEPEEIASTLKVHYLLSGHVCRDGDALAVTAELVDDSGYLVWSHSYTEQLDVAGQVTRSVSALLAEGVATRLGAVMPVPQEEPVDRLAYEQLLLGREYREAEDVDKARAAFEAALERKPDYAEAIFELALLEWPGVFGGTAQSARYEKSMLLAERALAMARRDLERNPNSAHSHYVVGRITWMLMYFERHLAWRKPDWDNTEGGNEQLAEAERHLRRSVELNPANSDAWLHLYLALEEAGREKKAVAVLEQGVERSPLDDRINAHLAIQWARRGRYNEAMALLERFKQLPEVPDAVWTQILRVTAMYGQWVVNAENIVEMLEREGYAERVRRGGGLVIWVTSFAWNLRVFGLDEESEALLARMRGFRSLPTQDPWVSAEVRERNTYEQASRMTDAEILDQGLWTSLPIVRALRNRGEFDRAIRLMEPLAREPLFALIRTWAPYLKLNLAIIYLEAGRDAEAAIVLEELSRKLEAMVSDGVTNPVTLEQLAVTRALQRRVDAAISTMEMSAALGNIGFMNCHLPELLSKLLDSRLSDPYAALRPDPRFQRLLGRCEAEYDRQASAIRELLAKRDLDVLLAPLIILAREGEAKHRNTERGR